MDLQPGAWGHAPYTKLSHYLVMGSIISRYVDYACFFAAFRLLYRQLRGGGCGSIIWGLVAARGSHGIMKPMQCRLHVRWTFRRFGQASGAPFQVDRRQSCLIVPNRVQIFPHSQTKTDRIFRRFGSSRFHPTRPVPGYSGNPTSSTKSHPLKMSLARSVGSKSSLIQGAQVNQGESR